MTDLRRDGGHAPAVDIDAALMDAPIGFCVAQNLAHAQQTLGVTLFRCGSIGLAVYPAVSLGVAA